MNEQERIAFIESRDGVEGAIAFCQQTLRVYRACLKRPEKNDPRKHFSRSPEYHSSFVKSLIELRKYLISKGAYYERRDFYSRESIC